MTRRTSERHAITIHSVRGLAGAVILAAAVVSLLATPATANVPAAVNPPQIVLGSQVPPEFPPAAMAGRFSGTVMMQVSIAADGSISEIEILDCTHKKLGFEEASISAVKKWKFEPATTEDGTPAKSQVRFRLSFNRARPGSPDTVSVTPFSAGGSPPDEREIDRRTRAASASPPAVSKPN